MALAPIQLDPDIGFVLVSELGSVQFYNTRERRFEMSAELDARPLAAARIDKQTIGVLYETFSDPNSLQVAKVVWGYEANVWMSMTLPRCTPTSTTN